MNLREPIQMQLFNEKKTFFQYFALFLKSTSSFEHFEKEYGTYSSCISEITNCKGRGYINA